MATVRKRISELTPLNSASLDTTLLGIDSGTTYKIELDVIADAVTNRVNTLDRSRLDSIESITSSFETKGRGILSGSVSYTSLTNIPQGIVSQSTDLTSLNQFTASISTASLVTSINNLNEFTSSYFTDSASFKSEITTEKNRIDAILSASNANSDTFAEVVSLINSVDLTNDNAFATFYTASNNRITSLENATGSYLTSLNGAISSSSQVIEILSPLNSVSASLISKTGSYATTGSNTFYGDQIMTGNSSTQRVELSVGDTYGGGKVFKILSGSYALIVDMNDLGSAQAQYMQVATNATSTTGSVNQSLILARSGSTPNAVADVNNPARSNYGLDMEDPAVMAYSSSVGGYTDWYIPSTTEIVWINQGVPGRIYEGFSVGNRYWTSNYADSPYTYFVSDGQGRTSRILGDASNGGSTQHPVVAIRKINQSYREIITTENANISITGSLSVSGSITGSTNFNTIVNKPTLISGSSQLTSSYDTRYALSASFVSSSNLSSIRTITSASYAALTPVSGTLYIIIG